MRIGVHLGLGGGYDKAIEHALDLGINTAQIFTHNPRGWSFKELDMKKVQWFRNALSENGIEPLVSHANYLINIAASNHLIWKKSLEALRKEIEYAKKFGCEYLVLHVGKHTGAGLEEGMKKVVKSLDSMKKHLDGRIKVLLETVAGAGTEVGARFEQLQWMIEMSKVKEHLGVTYDTCHTFAAGYDIRTGESLKRVVSEIRKTFGEERLHVVHLNDSLGDLGSHKDRHEHIGFGRIGEEGFRNLFHHRLFRRKPMILETPVDSRADDRYNVEKCRELWK